MPKKNQRQTKDAVGRGPAERPTRGPDAAGPGEILRAPAPGAGRIHAAVIAVAGVLTLIAYSQAVHGEFVYDDRIEIVQNQLIQYPENFWKAVTSDVWAFKGDKGEAWSNYWRPFTIAFKSLCFQLFGLNPSGWHVVNIVLHFLAAWLAYCVLLALRAERPVAALATWLFAAHPAHVESVAWIAAMPDLIMACLLFGSYLCYLRARVGRGWGWWATTLVLYLCGQMTKESAIAFPLIVLCSEWLLRRGEGGGAIAAGWTGLRRMAPFMGVALLFVIVRWVVLRKLRILPPGAADLASALLSVPEVLVFYLTQAIFPVQLGPIYGLRAVNAAQLDAGLVLVPMIELLVIGGAWLWAAWRNPIYGFGMIWFLFAIVLALDVRVFLPDDAVHDRYLYLAIFGVATAVAQAIRDLAGWALRRAPARAPRAALAVGAALSLVFAVRARAYVPDWRSDIAMWEAAVRNDPTSAKAFTELGESYRQAKRFDDAKRALRRAYEMNPLITNMCVSLAKLETRDGNFAEAERLLKPVLKNYPDYLPGVAQLGLLYQQQNRLDEAIAVFEQGIRDIPYERANFTINIAVLHFLGGRKDQALAALESVRGEIEKSRDPGEIKGWYYLGELYRESGRKAEAIDAYQRYLRLTDGMTVPEVLGTRNSVAAGLRALE